ncbi:MAG: GNAT family N-acetyltransferase [Flavobacteriales bacterium]|nr:GNAT family N-acetyltransferase [Flavobacteriales bacterium]
MITTHVRRIELANIQYVHVYWDFCKDSVRRINALDHSPEQIDKWLNVILQPKAVFRDVLRDNLWLCKLDDTLAGVMALENQTITSFYVSPDHLGMGIATAMMDELVMMARWKNMDYLETMVCTTAMPFFKKHGFKGKKGYVKVGGVLFPCYELKRKFKTLY